MEYKIEEILHSGSIGERYSPRTDGRYPIRIGRIIKLNPEFIEINCPLIINYLKKIDGTDYSNHYLRTSIVKNIFWFNEEENIVVIETNNSIYILVKEDNNIETTTNDLNSNVDTINNFDTLIF